MLDYVDLAEQIDKLDFETVFTINDGRVHELRGYRSGIYAPSVFHDPDSDVWIDGSEWRCLPGFTGQYGYHGAVMHPSEYVGPGMARTCAEMPAGTVFAIVTVEVMPDDREDPEDEAPAGWTIAYREAS